MGYYEDVCQLCAVSFAIARIRTATEPPDAAWKYHGSGFVQHDAKRHHCGAASGSGCSSAQRGERHEHLAGPGCRVREGYSGANISLAEMKGCRDVRAIVRKHADMLHGFTPEDDDEPWERETRYFFTGTGNGSPDEAPLENFDRIRHGVESTLISNIADGRESFPIPVHPTCWEIFKRVSVRCFGFVDVHGFWRFRGDEYEEFFRKFPRHPAVRNGDEQWWNHQLGSEWLAANPVHVPGLADSVKAVRLFDLERRSDAFHTRALRVLEQGHDPFARLPPEMRLAVQELLPSKSITALRLVSRAMQPVPNIVFRRLLLEDLPWLWEARDLPLMETDWLRLYRMAKFIWIELKGLKNRVRIWKDVTEICRRIRVGRESGKIQGVTGWEEHADEEL